MKQFLLILVLALVFTLSSVTDMIIHNTDGTMQNVNIDMVEEITFASYEMVEAQGIVFYWRTDGEYLHGIIEAPGTGWVAVGFDPENQMQGANILIGYVNEEGTVLRDDYGNSPVAHASDESLGGTDDIMMMSGMDDGEMTKIHFTIPLDSGDEYDKALTPGENYMIILAYGPNDDFTSYHTVRTIANIEL